MHRDPRAYLWDVQAAGRAIQSFTSGMSAEAYAGSELVRAAVERKFEVIGEALNQLSKLDASLSSQIPDAAKIVAFRNQLIHGYALVNVTTVWNAINHSLPVLLAQVDRMLDNPA